MEFNTGGTADSSNSGAMTGGTMASSMYKNGGGVGKLNGKPFSFYKYDTKKVKIAWKGKIQPFGAFYSVEDAIEELKNHYQTQQELREYSIVTPDGIIHYGKEYPIRYAKGGGLKPIPKGNKGLPKLPKSVRNKMGYMAKGGGVGKPMFKIGDKVKIASDNDNENYDNFRDKVLTITHIATNEKQHEGYDSSMQGMALYDFKDVPFSLYEYEIEPKKIKGGKMEWGGTAESSETGEFIGGENQSSMYARGGHVSKGEMVWKKLKSSDKIQFLYENFTPEITPRGQEILVGKAWNFLPKNVKIKFEAKYANVENYGEGGGTGVSSESGTTIGGENQSSMFENGGVSTGFTYDIGGL
jgi:hypothetical protein